MFRRDAMWGLARQVAQAVRPHSSRDALIYSIKQRALKFSESGFGLSSKRRSPYLFDIAAMFDGAGFLCVGKAYADVLVAEGLECDALMSPLHKGVPAAVATSITLGNVYDINVGVAFQRLKQKDHGEGGDLVGGIEGKRVVLLDDAFTTGKSLRGQAEFVRSYGRTGTEIVAAVAFLDRQERGRGTVSAAQEFADKQGIPFHAVATFSSLIDLLSGAATAEDGETLSQVRHYARAMQEYRAEYGIEA